MSKANVEIADGRLVVTNSQLLSAFDPGSENKFIGMSVGFIAGAAVSAASMLTKDSIDASDVASAVVTTAACSYVGYRAEDVLRGNTDIKTFAGEVALVSAVSQTSMSMMGMAIFSKRDKSKEYETEI